jgi:hypothetical protein
LSGALGTAGGIVVAWQLSMVAIANNRVDAFSITAHFALVDGHSWWHTTVYGPTEENLKPLFLDEITEIRAACAGMWVIAGDFNLILYAADKNNNHLNIRRYVGHRRTGNIKEQLLLEQETILKLDMAQDHRPLDTKKAWLRRELKKKVPGLDSLQRTITTTLTSHLT